MGRVMCLEEGHHGNTVIIWSKYDIWSKPCQGYGVNVKRLSSGMLLRECKSEMGYAMSNFQG